MIFGDLGRYPMYVTTAVRCVKYWFRVINLPADRLPKQAYNMLMHLQGLGKKTWAYHVKLLLCNNGFGDVWLQQNVGDLSAFLCVFRQRLLNQFQQDWFASVSTSERFEIYSSIKPAFVTEKYFDYVQLRCFREAYTRFRFGISPIFIHKLRYKRNILPHNLLCPVCKREIEDEMHILFVCDAYSDFRRDVACLANQTHVDDIDNVMSADDEITVLQISRFLYRAFSKRKEHLSN